MVQVIIYIRNDPRRMIPRSSTMLALIAFVLSLAAVQAVKFELPAEKHPKPSESDHVLSPLSSCGLTILQIGESTSMGSSSGDES